MKYLYLDGNGLATQSETPPTGFNEVEDMGDGVLACFKFENGNFFSCNQTTGEWELLETWVGDTRPTIDDTEIITLRRIK